MSMPASASHVRRPWRAAPTSCSRRRASPCTGRHEQVAPISIYDVANDRTSRDNLILVGAFTTRSTRASCRSGTRRSSARDRRALGDRGAPALESPAARVRAPGSFIPQVEETMLIDAVTQTVIETAFGHAARFRDAGHHLRVAVNLSVRNLGDRTLLESLESTPGATGSTRPEIELEITESAVMDDPEHCIRLISRAARARLRGRHRRLRRRALVARLSAQAPRVDAQDRPGLRQDAGHGCRQPDDRPGDHRLARSLGLETIAEGVEDERSIALLREWGCNYAQGYAIHKPAPADALLALLDERRAAPSGAVGAPARPAAEPA